MVRSLIQVACKVMSCKRQQSKFLNSSPAKSGVREVLRGVGIGGVVRDPEHKDFRDHNPE